MAPPSSFQHFLTTGSVRTCGQFPADSGSWHAQSVLWSPMHAGLARWVGSLPASSGRW